MIRLFYVFLLCSVLAASACRDTTPVDDVDPIINIPVDFNIDLWEKLDVTPRNSLSITVETVKLYECENYEVMTTVDRGSNTIVVTLEEIIEPVDCITAESPATAIIDIDELEDGFFDILINLKEAVSNGGILSVTDSKFRLEMNNEDGIDLLHTELHRVPTETVWGYLSYEGDNIQESVNKFYQNIGLIAEPSILDEGYYGYFSVNDTNGGIELNATPAFASSESFVYHYADDVQELQQLIGEFNENSETRKIELKLFTADGQEF